MKFELKDLASLPYIVRLQIEGFADDVRLDTFDVVGDHYLLTTYDVSTFHVTWRIRLQEVDLNNQGECWVTLQEYAPDAHFSMLPLGESMDVTTQWKPVQIVLLKFTREVEVTPGDVLLAMVTRNQIKEGKMAP